MIRLVNAKNSLKVVISFPGTTHGLVFQERAVDTLLAPLARARFGVRVEVLLLPKPLTTRCTDKPPFIKVMLTEGKAYRTVTAGDSMNVSYTQADKVLERRSNLSNAVEPPSVNGPLYTLFFLFCSLFRFIFLSCSCMYTLFSSLFLMQLSNTYTRLVTHFFLSFL